MTKEQFADKLLRYLQSYIARSLTSEPSSEFYLTKINEYFEEFVDSSEKLNDDFFEMKCDCEISRTAKWLDECPDTYNHTIIGGKCKICCCDITDKHSLISGRKRWGLCDNCYDDQVCVPE